jgi:hypothetical protein
MHRAAASSLHQPAKEPTVSRITSHIAVAAAALAAGGLGATAFSSPEPARQQSAIPAQPAPPEQVRTVVVTKTIHRVRHVRVHPHRPAPSAAPPPPVAVAPRPAPAPVPVATRRPVTLRPAPAAQPLKTRSSGGAGGGGGEREGGDHEGGGDD